jgi:hypothetical protein
MRNGYERISGVVFCILCEAAHQEAFLLEPRRNVANA